MAIRPVSISESALRFLKSHEEDFLKLDDFLRTMKPVRKASNQTNRSKLKSASSSKKNKVYLEKILRMSAKTRAKNDRFAQNL